MRSTYPPVSKEVFSQQCWVHHSMALSGNVARPVCCALMVWPPGLCYLLREAREAETVSISGREWGGEDTCYSPGEVPDEKSNSLDRSPRRYVSLSSSNEAHPVSPNYHRSSNIADTQYLGSTNFFTRYLGTLHDSSSLRPLRKPGTMASRYICLTPSILQHVTFSMRLTMTRVK